MENRPDQQTAPEKHVTNEGHEPNFIWQNFDSMTPADAREWFRWCAAQARERGAVLSRAVVGEEGTPYEGGYLFESWLEYPDDQGAPHWQMVAL